MSKKINCYAVIDWETGGIPDHKKGKTVPVCEFAAMGINGITLEEVLRYDNVVKPYDKSLLYEEGAMKVHGLTAEVCERDGIRLAQLVEEICQVFEETNVYQSKICRPIIVGHNVTFDIPLLQEVFERAQTDLSQYVSGYYNHKGQFVPHYIDTMHQSKGADAMKDVKYNLTECAIRHASNLVDGHRALNDVIATASLFRAFIAKSRGSGGMEKAADGSGMVRKTFQI